MGASHASHASHASRDEAVTRRVFCVKEDVASLASKGQSSSILHRLSLHRLLLPCRYSGSGSGSGSAVLTLFYSALLNLPLSRPTDRSEENLLLNTQFSLPLTTITYHLTYSPNSKLVLLLLPAQPTTTTTTTTSTPASAVPCSFPPLFPLCPLCPLYHSSLPLIFPLAHPPVRPQRPPTTPSDHLCQRPQTVA